MKDTKLYCYLLFFTLFATTLQAQIPRCPTDFTFSPPPKRSKSALQMMSFQNVNIPVAFHIIHATDGTGNVNSSVIEDQIDVLNNAYSGTGFSFYLLSIDRTANNNWFNNLELDDPASQIEHNVKNALTIDTEHVLNIYTADTRKLGWAWLPHDFNEDHYLHGVVLRYTTLPGQGAGSGGYDYDDGDTGVHEVGHYLGLYHTFQGGCSGAGDYVDDTPYEYADGSQTIYQCTQNRDTCPTQPGYDSIHNYMNFTDDDCMDEFTNDQIARMQSEVTAEKPSLGDSPNIVVSTIDRDTEWYGVEPTISGNLSIPSGITLKIHPGITIQLSPSKKVIVNGTLIASGSSGSKITFTSSGTWYGIEYYNASGGQVFYSIIQNAQYGVRVINSSPALAWNTIRYNTVGVQFDNNSYIYGGSLQGNVIENNFDGVKCYQYSDPGFTSSNVIRYNIYNGVYGDATSVPNLGLYYPTGHNSLYYNGTEVWSNYSGTIYARSNWWGEPDPTPNVSSNVDWSNYLNYDPNSGMGVVLAKAGASERRSNEFAGEAVADTVGIAEVNRAHEALLKGEYARALSLFEGIVGTYPDHFSGRRALAFVGRCLQKLNRANETVARRDQLVQNHAGKEIFGLSHSLAVGDLIKSEQYAEAIDRCSAILRDFPGTDLAKYALFDLGSIHWYRLADQKTGEQYYRDLIAQWPDDDLAISALATLGEWVPREHALPQPPSEPQLTKSGEIPGRYALLGNYPNPFNPTTTISYALPVRADVKVVLYNIMGREIKTYQIPSQAPGYQNITWDGTDVHGRPVASGVYLYRISARSLQNDEQFVQTAKLMLLK